MDMVEKPAMPAPNQCPQCGTPLQSGALAGLCPACLLKQGAAADTVTEAKQPAFNPPGIAELAPLFPQLEILELIGKGGMGAVYKARQKQLDRLVALKILPPGIGNDPAFAERFAREAKALAKLNHPGIVTLYEFGQVRNTAIPPQPVLSPSDGEQRYLILGDKVWIFEGVVHEDDQFPHDGGEGDFGGFAGRAQALIERLELAVGARRHQCRHV